MPKDFKIDPNFVSQYKRDVVMQIIKLTSEIGGLPPWILFLRNGDSIRKIEIAPGVFVDLDKDRNILTIEYHGV